MNTTKDTSAENAAPGEFPSVQQTDLRLGPDSRIFGYGEDSTVGGEQYRLLLGRLLHLQTVMPLKRLLVTSAGHGEGKTHVCANLAITMARETNRKILLVDADLRKPDIQRVFGISNEYGVSDILRNGHDTWKAIRKVRGMNLFVLTAGSATSQPVTTSSILTLKMLLDQMNPAFDLVIIDTPPVLAVADTPLLAKLADGILFVVGASGTPRDLIIEAKGMLETVPVIGAVLNRVSPITARHASYYRSANGESKQEKSASGNGKPQKQPGQILS